MKIYYICVKCLKKRGIIDLEEYEPAPENVQCEECGTVKKVYCVSEMTYKGL
jgi:DNA-directed RNA polymerase subunit RPC12/RpoP